jgi:hypothetical protein
MHDSSILLAYLILITVISAKIVRWKTGTKTVPAGNLGDGHVLVLVVGRLVRTHTIPEPSAPL